MASKNEIINENADYFSEFKIQDQYNLKYKLYRIIGSLKYNFLSFIKTNSLNIFPIGISDGSSLTKSYPPITFEQVPFTNCAVVQLPRSSCL